MTRSRRSRSTRVAISLSVAIGATIAAAALAGGGSAQSSPRTLDLLATAQEGVGFQPSGEPAEGDRFGGGAKITGDESGIQRSVCTVIGNKQALCAIQLHLSRGRLSAQGLVPQRTDHTQIPITGGTGAYNGARGTAVATQISETRTRFTVKLLR
jgi:hypothetical protein